MRAGDRISDALAAAGGPIRPTQVPAETIGADLAAAMLYRVSGEVLPLHLDLLYTDPKSFNDLPLVSGDVIVVPEGRNVVEVSGYVQKPGQYPFRAGETVRGALAMAGGPLLNVGSTTTVNVRHKDGATEDVNVERDDPPVRPGDSLSVPYMRERVAVVGAVTSPGVFDWHEGDTVVTALARAAGPRGPEVTGPFVIERGNPERVVVLRRDGEGYRMIQVPVARFYRKGEAAGNPPVEPGDVVFVPARGQFDFEALTRDLLLLPGLLAR
jgi:protein involved in polysaccharide export with SLBB domain